MRVRTFFVKLTVGAFCALWMGVGEAHALTNLTTLAYTRQQIPGLGGSVYYGNYYSASITPSGDVIFVTDRQPAVGVGPISKIVGRVDRYGQTSLVADPQLKPVIGLAPVDQGDYFASAGRSDAGVVFSSGTGAGWGFGIVNGGPVTAPGVVARIGSSVAGYSGTVFSGGFQNLVQGRSGQSAFVGETTGTISGRSLWAWSTGSGLQQVLMHGQPIVTGSSGPTADLLREAPYASIGGGVYATSVYLSGSGVVSGINNFAAVGGTPGNMSILARGNDPVAPGSEWRWNQPGVSDVNAAGLVAMRDEVRPFSGNTRSSFWIAAPGAAPAMVAIAQTPVPPGVGADGMTLKFCGDLKLNSKGQMVGVIVASTAGNATRLGLLTGTLGNTRTIAMQEAQIPGMPLGTKLQQDFPFGPAHISESGLVAFTGVFADPAAPGTTPTGLWLVDQQGNYDLLARTQQVVQLAPGDTRTIASFYLPGASGGPDGNTSAFSDAGVLLFQVQFTDGSYGLFKTLPAPGAGLLLCGFFVPWTRRSRRR